LPILPPVASIPAPAAPAPTSVSQSGGGGSPVCCTHFTDASDPCSTSSCAAGSDMKSGFCVASSVNCQTCQGHWCPNGLGGGSGSASPTAAPAPLPQPATVPQQPWQQATQPGAAQPTVVQVQPSALPALPQSLPVNTGGWAAGGIMATPAPMQATSGGGGACCSSAKDASDPCGSCYPGSGITSGWCVAKEEQCTGNCGGHWCPDGIVQRFEETALDDAKEALGKRMTGEFSIFSGAAAALLVGGFVVAAWVRLRPRGQQEEATDRLLPSISELEPLGTEA